MSKTITTQIKGIAILMMIIHHTFGFPSFWEQSTAANTVPEALLPFFSTSLKLCVAIFAFISGYGFSKSSDFSAKKQICRATRLLEVYWSQLIFIFLPIFLFGGGIITPSLIINNLFALKDQLIIFSWYVYFYLFVLILVPFVHELLDKGLFISLAITFVGGYAVTIVFYFISKNGNYLLKDILDCSTYFPTVCIGYICGKYLIFEKANRILKHPIISIVIVIAVLLARMYLYAIKGFLFDIIYAPLFCFAMTNLLLHSKYIAIPLKLLGTVSSEMWFLHSLFFWSYSREVLQKIFVIPSRFVTLLIILTTTFLCSFGYHLIVSRIKEYVKRKRWK